MRPNPITLVILLIFSLCFYTSGSSQNALSFDGTNDYVQTTCPGVFGSANRTFEAWINIRSSASTATNRAILDYGVNIAGSRNTFLVRPSSGQIMFIAGGTNTNISSSNNVISVNQWTHVAFVLNSGTGFLYVNGTQVGTGNLSNVNTPTTGVDVRIGQRVAGGSIPFPGIIDEVRIWNVALSQSQIQASRNNELCAGQTGLLAYYKFNQGTAGGSNTGVTTLTDDSGNSYSGTLNSFALTGSTSNWVTGATLAPGIATSATVNAATCDTYTSPSGKYTWSSAGTYADTLVNAVGCDSLITINLSIIPPTFSSLVPSTCTPYTSPSGKYTWSTSGLYSDTLVNAAGCDSIITIQLTVNQSTSSIITVNTCDSYTSPSGLVWTSSGVYADTIPNQAGCDSTIAINLIIDPKPSIDLGLDRAECDSVTLHANSPGMTILWDNGSTMQSRNISASGSYSITVTDPATNCASQDTVHLTINPSPTVDLGPDGDYCGSLTLDCGNPGASYDWCSGDLSQTVIVTNANEGQFCVEVTDINGCLGRDTIQVNIVDQPMVSFSRMRDPVNLADYVFTNLSTGENITYSWDFGDGSPIVTTKDASHTFPTSNPSNIFQVCLTISNACDTLTQCMEVQAHGVGIDDDQIMENVTLFPNPTTGILTLEITGQKEDIEVQIVDPIGRTVKKDNLSHFGQNGTFHYNLSKYPAGVYTVFLKSGEKRFSKKIVRL